jgi:hypothetical protein
MVNKILATLVIILGLYSSIITYKLVNDKPTIVTTTIPGDTIFTTNTVYKPVPYHVTEYNTDTIEIPSDTTELINRYKKIYSELYASKSYLDTLKNDSSAEVIITTHISRNTLDSLKMAFKNNRITTINTTIINNTSKFGVGLLLGIKQLSPILSYNIKDRFNLIGGYDLYNKTPQVGLIYNIK